ncbi:LysR family transcriptional regulator [Actinokineospora auranticolor]|uniref:DNA-binding transcriptional LysR family regulator n=1 Tax=Actinokineospora auranticolor TaxID=155976 RepID=A0A2S6GCW9_9PSEU|nr:LysR family transcriptional regulator [Actinokineospora auranticolor]PPK63074.1 DNA-binding transcriptional LysR family regulator [Actinokineospora auranticolor]
MDLELRHLRTLCAIADTGSLTRAAAVLRLSQPALTARLKRVEQEIGVPLFTRGPRGMVSTRVGDFVLLRARAILHGVDDLGRGVARFTDADAPVVAIGGAVGSVSVGLAARVVDRLPAVEVRLTMEYSPRLLWDLVAAGRLEAAATVDYPGYELESTSDIQCAVIADEPVFVALAPNDLLADRDEVALTELAERTWAMTPSDGAGWPDCFHTACVRAGFTPRVHYTSASAESIHELVAAGHAVTACQAVYRGGDGIVVRPLAGAPVRMRHVLLCRRDGPLADHADAMLGFAREAYRDYARRHARCPDRLDPATPAPAAAGTCP